MDGSFRDLELCTVYMMLSARIILCASESNGRWDGKASVMQVPEVIRTKTAYFRLCNSILAGVSHLQSMSDVADQQYQVLYHGCMLKAMSKRRQFEAWASKRQARLYNKN